MKRQSRLETDRVCVRFARRKTKLTVRKLDKYTVLIEGNRTGLEFLGELIKAQARDEICCHKDVSPGGPGSVFFTKESKLGIYIHRLPCKKPRAR
jgi:hypothetical protein